VLVAQLHQQVEDLRLNDDVERRCRLVEDEKPWLRRERPRDDHPLALPARQLVGVAACERRREPNFPQEPLDARAQRGAAGEMVCPQRLRDEILDGHARVERRRGLLKHELHVASPAPQRGAAHGGEVCTVEENRSARSGCQPEYAAGDGGLAGAGLADEPVDRARLDREIDLVDRAHGASAAAPRRKLLDDPAHLEQRAHSAFQR
jgi:hypothetical protein